jgi:hypothetical protein
VRDQGSLQANGGQEIDDVEAALVECRQAGGTGVVSGGGLLTLAWRGVSNEGADVARADLGYAVCSMHADAGESSGGTVAHGVACSFVRASPQADVEEERACRGLVIWMHVYGHRGIRRRLRVPVSLGLCLPA